MSRNRGKIEKMNLTSLMDIFTILVFFLLINSGSIEVMEAPKDMTLPESLVEAKPRETVVIFIGVDTILVQGQAVALVADVLANEGGATDPIATRLVALKNTVIGESAVTAAESQEVTILADKTTPFAVIKTIMSVCTGQGYENVSLAVIQKASNATTI